MSRNRITWKKNIHLSHKFSAGHQKDMSARTSKASWFNKSNLSYYTGSTYVNLRDDATAGELPGGWRMNFKTGSVIDKATRVCKTPTLGVQPTCLSDPHRIIDEQKGIGLLRFVYRFSPSWIKLCNCASMDWDWLGRKVQIINHASLVLSSTSQLCWQSKTRT